MTRTFRNNLCLAFLLSALAGCTLRGNETVVMPDGALLVSDDKAGVIYRIAYRKGS